MGLSTVKRLVDPFNPYRIIACYAIIFVVRADGNVKNSIVKTELEGPIQELLGNIIAAGEDERLLSEFSSDGRGREAVVLHQGHEKEIIHQQPQGPVELPLPSATKDHSAETGSLESLKNQFCTSTGVPDNEEPSSTRTKDRSFQNVFNFLPVLAPTFDRIRNEACRKHSKIFVHQLKRYKLWALQMYDSSAKLPSGILRGNANQLGDFDQCLAVTADDPLSNIEGKYCLASVDVQSTTMDSDDTVSLEQAVHLVQSYGLIRSTYNDPGHFIPQFTTIKWAMCVPAICSSVDVEQTLVQALQDYNETTGVRFDVHVDPDMCYVKEETRHPLGTATVCTLAFFAVVICLTAIATFRDSRQGTQHPQEQGQLERVVMAFSVRKNVNELLADLPSEGDINCIYGVRALCTVLLYLAHKVITFAFSPYSNRVVFTEVTNKSWGTVFRASLVYTDSFLFLSGVLTSFNMSKEMERKKHINWTKKYLARFIRLTPALVAVLLFYAYVLEHLGAGPLWHLVVKRNADLCKESLWRNIFYIQNFFPFEKMCATHTHQLALDMQLSLLSPLLVTLLWQWRVCGVLVLLCLHALSASLRYLATLQHHLSLVIFHGMSVTQLYQTANLSYSQSIHRATPYLLGVSLGFLLHKTDKHVHVPKTAVWAGWLLAIYFAYLSLLSPSNLGLRDYEYDVHYASTYAAFSPIIWSLALSWLVWACFTGYGGYLNTFLCCKGLVIFSRISYAVYLTQFAVFFYNVGSIRASGEFRVLRGVDVVEVLTVVVVSVALTLLFDLPMQHIKAVLMGVDKRRSKLT